jgi:CheY-like chemotaxis protein/HPt (histidine-containing phosphotransfer) domain-containing protein
MHAAMTDARKAATVLVVDDNAVNLKVVGTMLLKLGYDFQTAANGRDAVAAFERSINRRQRFGAILMDLNLPDLDGIQATRRILGAWGAQAPPIIALTASATPEVQARCTAAGMVDHLIKPLHVAALAQALQKWVMHSALSEYGLATEGRDAAIEQPDPAHDAVSLMDLGRLEEFLEFDDRAQTMTREIVGLFVADAPRRISAIQAAIAANDAGALSIEAHALKGAASNIGATALQAVCDRLEADSREVVPLDAALRLTQVQSLWARTAAALSRWT